VQGLARGLREGRAGATQDGVVAAVEDLDQRMVNNARRQARAAPVLPALVGNDGDVAAGLRRLDATLRVATGVVAAGFGMPAPSWDDSENEDESFSEGELDESSGPVASAGSAEIGETPGPREQ
jgi:hypothetical protein